LGDFFNQRGDLYEKVKTSHVGPESKKFFLALDCESNEALQVFNELMHSCPGLHMAMSGDDSFTGKLVKLGRLTEKQAIDVVETHLPK
jgi:hypothetical protein